ncbi:hypothetical protein [Burkholderia vietnamiensis]|uniref:hypothetical protein n=1 Tax=Burkholderia vietnamiensis TaxID=60552 RepID=UPI0015942610|nr:hypothetical protein [Burkholderia vietnamiensis]
MADTQKEIAELLTKVGSGKATATDKIKLAELLNTSAQEEAKEEFNQKIVKVKEFIEKQGLTFQEVADAIKGPPALIFQWVDDAGKEHNRYEGEKGKFPIWVEDLKKSLTKEKALSFAKNDKGRTFVENVYKPK